MDGKIQTEISALLHPHCTLAWHLRQRKPHAHRDTASVFLTVYKLILSLALKIMTSE